MDSTKRDFDGRVVVITGGAGGIGAAMAHRFATAGAKVALLDLEGSPLERVRDEVGSHGTEVIALTCDVTDEAACRATMAAVEEQLGGIDVLINNAGAVHRSAFADTELAVFRRVFEVNVFGSVHCTKAALPSLLARRGMIIVISSIAGLAPLYGRSGYVGSKHALHGLFESAASELAPQGVDVLMVCPTFTASGFEAAAMGPDGKPLNKARSKMGKLARPEDVADSVFHAAERRQRRLILSGVGWAAALLSRLAPEIYERLMVRGLASELANTPS
jgi:NAD(P)-dependent dehydrogenase (short-subunit alcohol dehydrogenase family)